MIPTMGKIYSLRVNLDDVAFGHRKKLPPAGFEDTTGAALHGGLDRGYLNIAVRPRASLHPFHLRLPSLPLVSHALWYAMSRLSREDKEFSKIASGLPRYVTRLSRSIPKDAVSD
jgi:hypothetical protein